MKRLGKKHVPDDESNLPNVDDPILRAIAEYVNHPSIWGIENYMKEKDFHISFAFVYKSKISKKIDKLE